jgi:quinol monooxygenase YgiN
MILEIVNVQIRPDSHVAFQDAVARGVKEVLFKAEGFINFEFFQGIEDANVYTFHVYWHNLDNHTVTFRQGPLFPEWRSYIEDFFAGTPDVKHVSSIMKIQM